MGVRILRALNLRDLIPVDFIGDLDNLPGIAESLQTALSTLVLQISRMLFQNQIVPKRIRSGSKVFLL